MTDRQLREKEIIAAFEPKPKKKRQPLFEHRLITRKDKLDYLERWAFNTPWFTIKLHKIMARQFIKRPSNNIHRLNLYIGKDGKPITAWTLVFTGRERHDWGFYTSKKGWVSAKQYNGEDC